MSIAELSQPNQRRAFLLTVSGVPVRWWHGAAPAAAYVPGTSNNITYTDACAIVHVSDQTSALDPANGFAAEGGVTVSLTSRGSFESASDPALYLLRGGWRNASRYCTLAAALAHTDAGGGTVTVDRTLASWASSGLAHVGAETFYYSGVAAGPYRFTGVQRAAAYSAPQAHVTDVTHGRLPIVTPEVVVWRGRWALLQVANRRPDGSLSDYIDCVRGFIDTDPEEDDDGATIRLTILPMSAKLTRDFGGQVPHVARGSTTLVHDYHASDGYAAITVEHRQTMPAGAWQGFSGAAGTGAGNTHVIVKNEAEDQWGGMFDTSAALTAPHPRNGSVTVDAAGLTYEANGITDVSNRIDLKQAHGGVAADIPLFSAEAHEVKQVTVHTAGAEAIVAWPQTALAAINDAAGWEPGTKNGTSGAWADVHVEMNGAPRFSCKTNVAARSYHPTRITVMSASDPYGGLDTWAKLWFGLDLSPPDMVPDYFDGPNPAGWTSWQHSFEVDKSSDSDDRDDRNQIRGPALGFYQGGEKFLLVKDRIVDPTFATQHVRVTYKRRDGETRHATIPITAVTEAKDPSDGTTSIGWRLTIAERARRLAPSFGDWPGEEPCKVEPIATFIDDTPTDIALYILMSGQGLGINSATYDVLPFGCNIDESDIDIASFTRYPVPAEFAKFSLTVAEGDTPEKVLGPMMRALGAAIVTRLNRTTGKRRLTLVRSTIERALDAVATLTTGDFSATRRPRRRSDNAILNRFVVTLFDPVSGEPIKQKIIFIDRASVDNHAGETKTLDLELRGLVFDRGAFESMARVLFPVVQCLMEQFGQTRHVYTFGLPMYESLLITVGETVSVTATDARAPSGAYGLTAEPMRVLETVHGWWTEGNTIRAVSHSLNGTGWAPAMRVASVAGLDVTVSANAYTRTVHPLTNAAQADVDYFAQNQAIEIIRRGNFAGRTTTTITSIAGNVVTVGAVPGGLLAGDTIRPREYDNSATAHRVYAYLADTDETIGGSAVAAFEIT